MSTHTRQASAPADRNKDLAPQDAKARKLVEICVGIAAAILIAFGGGSIVMSLQGRGVVKKELLQQRIVGAADMTPRATALEAKQAGLPKSVPLPSCNVAGKTVSNGTVARCFASYMRIHALESTGGKVYSELPQYASVDGNGTNDPEKALKSKEELVENPARALWVQETALSTALNASFMADQLGLFGIVVGVALLLVGGALGVIVLLGVLRAPATVALPAFVRKRILRTQAAGAQA